MFIIAVDWEGRNTNKRLVFEKARTLDVAVSCYVVAMRRWGRTKGTHGEILDLETGKVIEHWDS